MARSAPRRLVPRAFLKSSWTCRTTTRVWPKPARMVGSGAMVVFDDTTDFVKAAYNLARFFAHESCGPVQLLAARAATGSHAC